MATLTKQGRHGTLHRFVFDYGERDGYRLGSWGCWAYDIENALDQWHAENYSDGFWLLRYARKSDRPSREWTYHKIPDSCQTEGA